ncbi:coiled-coil domain-containing protein 97 isoform X1 [Tribolium castaneum]
MFMLLMQKSVKCDCQGAEILGFLRKLRNSHSGERHSNHALAVSDIVAIFEPSQGGFGHSKKIKTGELLTVITLQWRCLILWGLDITLKMTMEVEVEEVDANKIIDFLTSNESICFKSQQRGEDDLSKQQKCDIALELYAKSKLNFLVRFGKYMEKNQLDFFQQFTENCAESAEISIVLKDFLSSVTKSQQTHVKNRRYEALKELIREESYFSEIEMMKRNPLLYEQLVGQYLTEDEKAERDKINIDGEATLVKVLIEGIERDNAQVKRKKQEEFEDGMREEDESSDSGDSPGTSKQTYSQWGEFTDEPIVRTIKRVKKKHITPQEQLLLKEEFISTMYLDFLNGKDEDFDYSAVDNNDKYDSTETNDNDEEDKYFDSEEPATVSQVGQEESEDELDVFMSALNHQNPVVSQLSKDIQKL